MDNQQDRQLYWEVKQFLHGTPNMVPPPVKTSSLRDVAASVMNENKPFSQAKPPSHSNVFDATGSMLNAMKSLETKNNPGHIAYTKNGSTNPFNLNEALTKQNKQNEFDQKYIVDQPGFGTPNAPTMPDGRIISRDGTQHLDLKNDPNAPKFGIENSVATINPAINAQREENRYQSRSDAYVPMGELRSGVANTGAVIPSLSQQANAPQAPYQPAVPYEKQNRPAPAQTERTANFYGDADPVKREEARQQRDADTRNVALNTPVPQTTAVGTLPPVGTNSRNLPSSTATEVAQEASASAGEAPRARDKGRAGSTPVDSDRYARGQAFKAEREKNTPVDARKSGGQKPKSAGQYRGGSNSPQSQGKPTLQSTMAQQNQKATSDSLGQMGAVQNTSSTAPGGFQGSVLPPMNSLGSPRTSKTNEFKYSSGSRLT
jgi:hypothetical protein